MAPGVLEGSGSELWAFAAAGSQHASSAAIYVIRRSRAVFKLFKNRGVFVEIGNTAMSPQRILVVEDESLVRELLVEVLTDAGFEVDEAQDAEEAGSLIDADGYKLLLTDVHMPGARDGMDLALQAREHKPSMPILFVTARPDVLDRLKQDQIEAAFLAKPFAIAALVAAVRELINPTR
jgi:CheY-like chemotaxis protein